jgi:hypothetical protein
MWRLAVKRGGQCVVVGYKRFRIQPCQQIECRERAFAHSVSRMSVPMEKKREEDYF